MESVGVLTFSGLLLFPSAASSPAQLAYPTLSSSSPALLLYPTLSSSPALLLHPFTQPSIKCNYHSGKMKLLTISKHFELYPNLELLQWLQWPALTSRPYKVILSLGEPGRSLLVRWWPPSPLPCPLCRSAFFLKLKCSPLPLLGLFGTSLILIVLITIKNPAYILLEVCPALLRYALSFLNVLSCLLKLSYDTCHILSQN